MAVADLPAASLQAEAAQLILLVLTCLRGGV